MSFIFQVKELYCGVNILWMAQFVLLSKYFKHI